jgi:hypothetical protein
MSPEPCQCVASPAVDHRVLARKVIDGQSQTDRAVVF